MLVKIYTRLLKPVFDFLFAFVALLILSPVMVIIMFVVWIHFRSNPFFTQVRPGKRGQTFTLIKFKSMKDVEDQQGRWLDDHLRLTPLGKILRSTSLDELPQLLNILKGDMSLIGPRPLLVEYLPRYSDTQKRRHDVRPGITGWAQVNGRNEISWDEKLKLDVWYVDHISFGLDLKILWMTLHKVIRQEQINAGKEITMKKFEGHG